MVAEGLVISCAECGHKTRLTVEPVGTGGRPSRCTPELTERFVAWALAVPNDCATIADAAEWLELSEQTFRRLWLAGGKSGKEPYATFWQTLVTARRELKQDDGNFLHTLVSHFDLYGHDFVHDFKNGDCALCKSA